MKRLITVTLIIGFTSYNFAQSKFVLNNDAYVVLENSATLVLDDGSTTALSTIGTGGNIISEGEFNRVKWNIGTSTGSYSVPFTTVSSLTKIPVTTVINSAGIGTGSISFSTYAGVADNNTYKPSDVTHMYDFNTGSVNNSSYCIDRFWMIDAQNYTTKPHVTLAFTYRDSEYSAIGNSITEANLGAQRFNTSTSSWGDYLPAGVTNTTTNTTSLVVVPPSDFFRSWTLVENSNPLNTDISTFRISCDEKGPNLEWETVTETNLSRFEIEYLDEKNDVHSLETIYPHASPGLYQWQSYGNRKGVYRLVVVDNDEIRTIHEEQFVDCSTNSDFISVLSDHSIQLHVEATENSVHQFVCYDASGSVVRRFEKELTKGEQLITLSDVHFASGLYQFVITNSEKNNRLTFVIP